MEEKEILIKELISEYGSGCKTLEDTGKDVIDASFLDIIDEDSFSLFFDAVKNLGHIKTILVDPHVAIESMEIVSLLQEYIDSGINIEFVDNKEGGYLQFEIEYGVDDCSFTELRENSWPLASTFPEFLKLLSGIKEYIADLDEGGFELFKKISDDIYDRCGDGEVQFLNIKSIYNDPDELGDEDYILMKF